MDRMTKIITAVYAKGVFKPLAHVKLQENQKVRISVTDEDPDRSDKKWSALLKTVHRRNRKFSSKEVEADITAAIKEVRAKK